MLDAGRDKKKKNEGGNMLPDLVMSSKKVPAMKLDMGVGWRKNLLEIRLG